MDGEARDGRAGTRNGAPSAVKPQNRPTCTVLFWPLGARAGDITEYDYRQVPIYVRLLETEASGAPEPDLALVFLEKDPAIPFRIARLAARAHLNRAHWLLKKRFVPLLWCLGD